ncbi:ABC transporter substrate-binding protein [Solihabitans fulvus]|uniref:ABC transporter substrate-binding protein n=1 Tax=Solihabitans fulvus TaxID=1892852 RepID=A0A5B2WPD2_9PSEU|nr:ABC transporter substrate-binding protein [Solihabitans fulvus]KAA2252562.1 ABC transporter substrate-binding protein [Solihabitans fulvus]
MSTKTTALCAIGALLALALSACGGGSSSAGSGSGSGGTDHVKIMVGGMNKQIYLPAILAKQLDLYAKNGLQVDLSDEPAGVDAETQMLAGNVDGVVGFYDHNVDLQGKGKVTESIVQFAQVPGEVELVSTKATDVHGFADFKGKSVGVTGLGSSTNFLTKFLATRSGISPDQVNSVAVEAGQTFIAAMEQGKIQGGMTTEPTITALLKKGDAKVLVDMRTAEGARAALGGVYPAACLYMPTSWVNAHKDVAQKLANTYVQTLKWIGSHSAAEIADKLPADYVSNANITKDDYVKALDAGKAMFTTDGIMPADGPQTVLTVLNSFDPTVKGHTIDLAKTFTTEFAKNAH